MAWVFEVFDEKLEIRRALKLLKPEAARGEQFRRFQKEARLLAQFKHENLISVFDFGYDEETDCYFYVMELVDGQPLSGKGKLPLEQAVPIYLHSLNGLAQLHDREIVHRDIKPSNIIVSDDGRVLLADLGIARTDQHSSGLTQTIGAIGTYLYMSPEQAGGTEEVKKTSDVFSMGLSLYQSMVGSSVYDHIDDVHTTNGQNILFYLGALLHSGGQIDFTFPKDFHAGVAKVISKACRFHPEERYSDAREMYEALYEAFYPKPKSQEPVQAAPAIDPKLLAAGGVGALLILLALWQGVSWLLSGDFQKLAKQVEDRRSSLRAEIDAVQGSPYPMGQAVVAKVDERLESARKATTSAQLLFEESTDGWEAMLERALREYRAACKTMVEDHLRDELARAEGAADGAIEALVAGGAETHAAKELAELRQARGGLGTVNADTDCAQIPEYRQGLAAYFGPFVEGESSIANVLTPRWRAHLSEVRAAVLAIGAEAKQTNRQEPVFIEALGDADALAAEADDLEAAGEFAKAEAQLGEAGQAYETASRVTRMLALRDEVVTVAAESGSNPSEVLAPIDVAMRERNWDSAEQLLARALAGEKERIELARQRAEANTAIGVAENARTAAEQVGASFSAAGAMAAGDEALARARGLVEAQDFEQARAVAAEATRTFEGASENANASLVRVEEAGNRAMELRNQFASSDPCGAVAPDAQPPCLEGITKFDEGAVQLAAGNAPAAEASFNEVIRLLGRAKTENDRWDPAPTIQGLWPPAGTIVAYKGQTKSFRTQAEDRRGDELTYEWLLRGRPLEGSEAEITIEVDRTGGTLELLVKDEANTIRAGSWELVVENRAPTLTLAPAGTTIDVDTRTKQKFEARTADPDGDTTVVSFTLDGQPVDAESVSAESEVYTFEPTGPGNHELQVIATDSQGKSVVATRTIRVTEKPNRAPQLTVLTPPPGTLRVGESVEFRAQASDPDGDTVTIRYLVGGREVATGPSYRFEAKKVGTFRIEIQARDERGKTDEATGRVRVIEAPNPEKITSEVLSRYRAAYEKRSLSDLSAVRRLTSEQQAGLRGFFENACDIEMKVDLAKATMQSNGSVLAEFVQSVNDTQGCVKVDSRPSTVRVRIEKSGAGWWITDLL